MTADRYDLRARKLIMMDGGKWGVRYHPDGRPAAITRGEFDILHLQATCRTAACAHAVVDALNGHAIDGRTARRTRTKEGRK